MNALRDFFANGQARRNWLDTTINNALSYYLGPTGVDQKLSAISIMNPVNDVGSSMANAREVYRGDAGAIVPMITDMATVLAPTIAASKVGTDAAAAITDGILGVGMQTRQGLDDAAREFIADESGALRLWHGSPHDFDRFSMDKIGTGEGAQAYGHGLYFAENADVAEQYRKQLAGVDYVPDAFSSLNLTPDQIETASRFGKMYDDPAFAAEEFASFIRPRRQVDDEMIDAFRRARTERGSLYEVNINANPEDFLDWDAPLSAQPQKVREALREAFGGAQPVRLSNGRYGMVRVRPDGSGDKIYGIEGTTPDEARAALDEYLMSGKGSDIAVDMGHSRGQSPEAATAALREAGIPGIRYLDAGSRGAGDGSRNYVLFDDRLATVLSKNGERTPEGKAQGILDLLTSGRASEVTDDMLDLGDPVQNARLNMYLFDHYDLPMDEASRMARARDMGYHSRDTAPTALGAIEARGGADVVNPPPVRNSSDNFGVDSGGISIADAVDDPLYHGTTNDFVAFDPRKFNSGAGSHSGRGVYTTPDELEALEYGDILMPLVSRGQNPSTHYLRDYNWVAPGNHSEWLQGQGFDALNVRVQDIDDITGRIESDWLKERVDFDPRNIRSRFARFDPRLAHLRNLSAGVAGTGVLAPTLMQDEGEIDAFLSEHGY